MASATELGPSEPGQAHSVDSQVLNPVNWWEIEVPDLGQASAFYGTVFGWTMVPFGESSVFAKRGESLVCGLTLVAGTPSGRGVRAYLDTSDLEATLARVVEAGGAVTTPRTLVDTGGDMGWYALFTDPSGVTLGLWTGTPPS